MVTRFGGVDPVGLGGLLAEANSLPQALDVYARWLRAVAVFDQAVLSIVKNGGGVNLYSLEHDRAVLADEQPFPEHELALCLRSQTQQTGSHVATPVNEEVDHGPQRGASTGRDRSWAIMPLVSGGECYGTISVSMFDHGDMAVPLLSPLSEGTNVFAFYLRMCLQLEEYRLGIQTDELTGLLSRKTIIEKFEAILDTDVKPIATLYIDVDEFKSINDTYGHVVGDTILHTLAQRLKQALRDGDLVGRLGGDEFLVVLTSIDDAHQAVEIANRLNSLCRRPIRTRSARITARLSIGVAISSETTTNADELLATADAAMYRAKRTKHPVVIADETVRNEVEIIKVIDRDMEGALQRGEFRLFYQPVCGLADRLEVLGCEALLRWHHPDHGLIPPPLLLERLEVADLIKPFTDWTLDQAAADLDWLRQSDSDWAVKGIAMNLNASQLDSPDYVETHIAALRRHGLRDEDFIVELVEVQQVEAGSMAEANLIRLAALGICIGLDDFGVGRNVLGYFSRFPIHSMKLDRSLITDLPENRVVRTVVNGLVRMADELGIETLAEGIETEEQLAACLKIGVDKGQGYLLAKPMPIEKILEAGIFLNEPIATTSGNLELASHVGQV